MITDAYPDAKVVASPSTRAHIEDTIEGKVAYWGPVLGENDRQKTVLPETIDGDTLSVDGMELEIVGLEGHDPKHTFVWIPSAKTVTGGVRLPEGLSIDAEGDECAPGRYTNRVDARATRKATMVLARLLRFVVSAVLGALYVAGFGVFDDTYVRVTEIVCPGTE